MTVEKLKENYDNLVKEKGYFDYINLNKEYEEKYNSTLGFTPTLEDFFDLSIAPFKNSITFCFQNRTPRETFKHIIRVVFKIEDGKVTVSGDIFESTFSNLEQLEYLPKLMKKTQELSRLVTFDKFKKIMEQEKEKKDLVKQKLVDLETARIKYIEALNNDFNNKFYKIFTMKEVGKKIEKEIFSIIDSFDNNLKIVTCQLGEKEVSFNEHNISYKKEKTCSFYDCGEKISKKQAIFNLSQALYFNGSRLESINKVCCIAPTEFGSHYKVSNKVLEDFITPIIKIKEF
jgi:hypothetical protein